MTLAKRFLLGSAAALVATTGAQAADLGLPVAPAVDYVQICSIGSFTGFILPGSDVCFDISGFARFQADFNEEGAATNDDYNIGAEAAVSFDARTMTEFGLLRGFLTIGSDTFEDDDETAEFEKAFIQIGGLTAGVTDSFFDPVWTGYALGAIGGMAGDVDHALIAYTAAFGNGFTATLSLENDEARQGTGVAATTATDLVPVGGGAGTGVTVVAASPAAAAAAVAGSTGPGVLVSLAGPTAALGVYDESATMPDIVASLRVTQAWGSAGLSAALHEVDPALATAGSEFGYAIGASAEFNLPFGYTSSIGFMGTYTHGATGYTGIDNNVAGIGGTAGLPLIDFTPSLAAGGGASATSIELTTAWVVGGGFEYGITEMLDLEVDGFYGAVDHDEAYLGAGANLDYDVYSIRGSLNYRPVAGLTIQAGVDYVAVDVDQPNNLGVAATADDDEVAGRIRITRSF